MTFSRYAVPLAMAGLAAAQSSTNSCSASATTTITSSGDLPACTVFTGTIAISPNTQANIDLGSLQTIDGSLVVNNATQLSQISASSLTTITDTFSLAGLTILTALTFPQLAEVGTIEWTALPALQGVAFTAGVTKVSSLTIDNTKLNSLDGIDLAMAATISVTNNPHLDSIVMQLGNVSDSLNIGANGPSLDIEFPNLIWANDVSLNNASAVSFPSLAAVNGSLGLISNTFSNISAPNLTTIGHSLAINLNTDLTNISFPELTGIGGGLSISGNPQLESITGFPSLKTIGGGVILQGVFSNATLPDLSQVRGGFNVTSSGNVSASCATFKGISGTPSSPIEGKFTCIPLGSTSSTSSGSGGSSSGSPTSGGSGSSSSPTGKSSASGLLIPSVTAVLGAVAALFVML